MIVKVGRHAYVRYEKIVRIICPSEIEDSSDFNCSLNDGRAITLKYPWFCAAVFLDDRRIILTGVSVKTLQRRLWAAKICNDSRSFCGTGICPPKKINLGFGGKKHSIEAKHVDYIVEIAEMEDGIALYWSQKHWPRSKAPRTAVFLDDGTVALSPFSAKTLLTQM